MPNELSHDMKEMTQRSVGVKVAQRLGLTNKRNLYWASAMPNFGDWVGPLLYRHISGTNPYLLNTQARSPAQVFLSVGSILGSLVNDKNAVVWGSGILRSNEQFRRPLKICSVRGPRTRSRCLELGYDCPEIFGDPAILLPRFYQPKIDPVYKLGIVPHYVDLELVQSKFAGLDGVRIVDVRQSVENVVDEILNCEVLVSSSLHGIIVSHAYGRRCRWIKFSGKLDGDDVKFFDYFESFGGFGAFQPLWITENTTPHDLIGASGDTVIPELGTLQEETLLACPFPRQMKSGNSD